LPDHARGRMPNGRYGVGFQRAHPTVENLNVTLASWILIAGFGVLGAYGLLNLVTPTTTIRWQNRATARHRDDDPRRVVGLFFQGVIGQEDSAADGSQDATVRRRVRYVGASQIVFALVAIGVVIAVS
jgi:hypothetical protein